MKFIKIVISQKKDRLEAFLADVYKCIDMEVNLINKYLKQELNRI